MDSGSDPFKYTMEIGRLAADLHRLGDIFPSLNFKKMSDYRGRTICWFRNGMSNA